MNILIVDDEAQIRRWFEALVDRTDLGVKVSGTCGNGKEALEFCRANQVDLVITDIKMPIMNGLELIRHLSAEHPSIRTLILSSYDEFQYASEALKLGAADYILKAEVTVDGLREVIRTIQTRMESERQRKEEVYTLKSTLNENQYALRAIYFKDLIRGHPAALHEFRSKMTGFRIVLADKHLMMMTVSLDDYPNCLSHAKIQTPLLLDLAVINIMDETIRNETGGGCSFLYQENVFVVMCNAGSLIGKSSREESIRHAHRISNNLQEFLQVPASVGISEPYPDLSQLERQFRESAEALRQKRFYGKRNIVWFPDLKLVHSNNQRKDWHPVVIDISYHVEMESYERALQVLLSYMANNLQTKESSESSFKAFCLELIYTILQKIRKIEQQIDRLARYNSATLHEELSGLHTFEEVKNWLLRIVTELLKEAKKLRPSYSEPIRQAFRYLNSQFAEDISLQQVADYVHLNKTYLSELFKKETGITFNDHLTRIRIDKAKELIIAGEEKMGALAELVGYPNASYFTKVFKKTTGMTPLEYKQRK
ncbi:response regulator [Cohnella silvisoli]|uniref:Response regulator n=1 Tax=Cohnella silvisoli TaxID=2873699 RepID=A0ABV1L481_9BACL|nr:response regulator [Cohnella silvisoli]MCD9025861.1 response regulator [Cohnella silvisoli]